MKSRDLCRKRSAPHRFMTCARRIVGDVKNSAWAARPSRPDPASCVIRGAILSSAFLARVDIESTLSIQQVMKNGRLYDGNTLDEVWHRRRKLAPAWFADDRPGASSAR